MLFLCGRMSRPVRESLRRVRHIAGNTFTEALRQRFAALLALLGAALAASGFLLRTFNFGNSELRFLADFGFGAMFLFGSLLAVLVPAQLFFSEMDNRTALPLLARPVRRWEFIAGKFAGAWTLLGAFTAVLGAVLGALLRARAWELAGDAAGNGAPEPFFSAGGLAVFLLLQWLRLGVVAALTLLVCSFARSFLYAAAVSLLAVVACQMRGIGQTAFDRAQTAPWLRAVGDGLRVIPDLQVFDLGGALVLEPTGAAPATLSAFAYGALYVPALLLLAVWLFADREI